MAEVHSPRAIFLPEIGEAVRDHPLGPWFVAIAARTDDGHAASRIVREIADLIRGLGAAPEHPGATIGWMGLTDAEAAFVGRFRLRDRAGVISLIQQDGWTARRIQKELVSLLRLLIALDPENLTVYDVSVAADDVLDVDSGRRTVIDVVRARLNECRGAEAEGLHFRHGLALGMRLATAVKDGESLSGFRRQIEEDLGVTAPMKRPARASAPR
jgi:hypothetical protein